MFGDLSISIWFVPIHKTAGAPCEAGIKHQRQFLYITGKWRGSRKQPRR